MDLWRLAAILCVLAAVGTVAGVASASLHDGFDLVIWANVALLWAWFAAAVHFARSSSGSCIGCGAWDAGRLPDGSCARCGLRLPRPPADGPLRQ